MERRLSDNSDCPILFFWPCDFDRTGRAIFFYCASARIFNVFAYILETNKDFYSKLFYSKLYKHKSCFPAVSLELLFGSDLERIIKRGIRDFGQVCCLPSAPTVTNSYYYNPLAARVHPPVPASNE